MGLTDEDWLTLYDVARTLRLHIQTVRTWVRTGELNAVRLGGKSGYRVRRTDFEAFLKARETGRGR